MRACFTFFRDHYFFYKFISNTNAIPQIVLYVKYILSKSELEIPEVVEGPFPPEHVWHFAKTQPFSMKIFLERILHILIDQNFFEAMLANDEKFKLLENRKPSKM